MAYNKVAATNPMILDDWAQFGASVKSSKLCTRDKNFASVDPASRAEALSVGAGGMTKLYCCKDQMKESRNQFFVGVDLVVQQEVITYTASHKVLGVVL